jgi:hypothetical protein
MKKFKILILSLSFIGILNVANACHQSTVTYLGVTENANGTVTYDLEICIGFEDTWGFLLTFNTSNVVSVSTTCLLSPTSGLNACATIGSNTVEYGNYDNTGAAPWLPGGIGVQCYNISVTLDAPASSVDLFGTEYEFGPCSSSAPLPSCLPSVADYTVYIEPNDCGPNNADLIFDGVTVVDGVSEGLGQQVYNICGCASNFSVSAPVTGNGAFACAAGVVSYSIYNSSGTLLASGGGGSSSTYGPHNVSCVPLSTDFLQFEGTTANTSIVINWSAVQENANLLYVIEKSKDIHVWEPIGFINSIKEVNTLINYKYEDTNPYEGVNYYRLKVIDNYKEKTHNPIAVSFLFKETKLVKLVNSLGQVVDDQAKGHIIELFDDGSARQTYKE